MARSVWPVPPVRPRIHWSTESIDSAYRWHRRQHRLLPAPMLVGLQCPSRVTLWWAEAAIITASVTTPDISVFFGPRCPQPSPEVEWEAKSKSVENVGSQFGFVWRAYGLGCFCRRSSLVPHRSRIGLPPSRIRTSPLGPPLKGGLQAPLVLLGSLHSFK